MSSEVEKKRETGSNIFFLVVFSRPRSLDRRRAAAWRNKVGVPTENNEFHEGLLLDALFQMYPNVGMNAHANSGHRVPPTRLPYILPINANAQQSAVNAYESVPVLNHLRQHNQHQHHYHRPHHNPPQYYPAIVRNSHENFTNTFRGQKPLSQDSDSGYSNNTSGGRGSSSSRSKNETLQRISTHSEFPLS